MANSEEKIRTLGKCIRGTKAITKYKNIGSGPTRIILDREREI